jgi:hypothetical protein
MWSCKQPLPHGRGSDWSGSSASPARFFTLGRSLWVNRADDSPFHARNQFPALKGSKLRGRFLLPEFLSVDAVLGTASGVLVTKER